MKAFNDPFFVALFNTVVPRIIVKANIPDFTIVKYNQAFTLATNTQFRDLHGKNVLHAFPSNEVNDGLHVLTEAFQKAIEIKEPVSRPPFSYDIADANGNMTTQWWQMEIAPIAGQEGTVEYLLITTNNITEKRATVSERTSMLLKSEARLRSIFEQAPLAFCILTGEELIIELANDHMLKIWGKREEVIGLPYLLVIEDSLTAEYKKVTKEVFKTGKPYVNHEIKATTANGKETYFSFSAQPITHGQDTAASILIIIDDITDAVLVRKENEQVNEQLVKGSEAILELNSSLVKSRGDLLFALDAAGLGTFDLDPVTLTFTGNDQLKRWFGLDRNEKIELSIATDVIIEEDRQRVIDTIARTLDVRYGGTYDIDYTILNPENPVPRVVRAKGKALFDAKGKAIRLSGTLQDITEQKRDEVRKNDFIGMVSHELKTPLTSLKAYIQLLQVKANKSADDFAITSLNKANTQIIKMTSMINSFLNVSRLESSQIHIDSREFDLSKLIAEAEDDALNTITTHQIVFEKLKPTPVNADYDKIGQVINNLISNAVKYSPSGSTITVASNTMDGMAQLSVKDEGMGISEKDIARLFDRYYRVEGDQMRSISGFGIGLYLCSEIIQRHQGKIWVESELGKGSVFYFSLPIHLTLT
ncbi:MAG: PAS domain S-box protein [Pedobacter sp.]|nr:MAG: PAS domain S-box protein [Pedobacter sp.]